MTNFDESNGQLVRVAFEKRFTFYKIHTLVDARIRASNKDLPVTSYFAEQHSNEHTCELALNSKFGSTSGWVGRIHLVKKKLKRFLPFS